ncbi:hypothetical protein [Armatimonas sp.]|uniref:hypothetical protein n=1 Tax=Armatimonas sp. TaxID=1872638 RepID=UPI00286ABAE7|nr:hypothetical protein [Armatimonas sp.]
MEATEEQIQELIEQLQSNHYKTRLIVLGKLVEYGEATVPMLLNVVSHNIEIHWRYVIRALAAISTLECVEPVVSCWEERPDDPVVIEAFRGLVDHFTAEARLENLPALLRLLTCYKRDLNVMSHGQTTSVGKTASLRAADILILLARHTPTPQLRVALPLLKRDLWHGVPKEFAEAYRQIDEATHLWKDLPLAVSELKTSMVGLPLPTTIPERGESETEQTMRNYGTN